MLITVFVCAALISLDQLFKMLVSRALAPDGIQTVIPGIVELRYVKNDGAAFSILSGQQGLLILITGIALLVVAYILLFRRPKVRLEYVAFLFIFSGGVGNFIDRVANGFVVDYINVLFMQFAVFNFADILVCVGFALLIFSVIKTEIANKNNPTNEKKENIQANDEQN